MKEGGEGGGRGVRERGSACKRRRGFEGHDSALELALLQQGLSVWPGADGRALPEASGKRKRVQSVDGAGVRHDEAAGGAGHSRSIPSGLSAGEGVEALVLPACVSGHVGCGSLGREREGQVRGRAGDSGHASKDTHADGRGTDVRVHSGGVCRVGALALVPSTRALWLLGESGRVYETQTSAPGHKACWLLHPGPQVCSAGCCVSQMGSQAEGALVRRDEQCAACSEAFGALAQGALLLQVKMSEDEGLVAIDGHGTLYQRTSSGDELWSLYIPCGACMCHTLTHAVPIARPGLKITWRMSRI